MAHLTKDEIRLLHFCINEAKFEIYETTSNLDASKRREMVDMVEALEDKCLRLSVDVRRAGRTSQDSFNDLLKRLVNKNVNN